MTPTRIIIDTDPGIDDALAFLLAYVDVDTSGGVSMGKTFADFYHGTKKPANMKVALGVSGEDFIELFLQRMEALSQSIPDYRRSHA